MTVTVVLRPLRESLTESLSDHFPIASRSSYGQPRIGAHGARRVCQALCRHVRCGNHRCEARKIATRQNRRPYVLLHRRRGRSDTTPSHRTAAAWPSHSSDRARGDRRRAGLMKDGQYRARNLRDSARTRYSLAHLWRGELETTVCGRRRQTELLFISPLLKVEWTRRFMQLPAVHAVGAFNHLNVM